MSERHHPPQERRMLHRAARPHQIRRDDGLPMTGRECMRRSQAVEHAPPERQDARRARVLEAEAAGAREARRDQRTRIRVRIPVLRGVPGDAVPRRRGDVSLRTQRA